jgi:probable rRNA maturation factor
MLHLAGYDHETDNGQMAKVEYKLRTKLKLPVSLIGRTQSPKATSPSRPKQRRRVGRSR